MADRNKLHTPKYRLNTWYIHLHNVVEINKVGSVQSSSIIVPEQHMN